MDGPALYRIEHATRFFYTHPVVHCAMYLHLAPRNDGGQRLSSFEVSSSPSAPARAEEDPFGNIRHLLAVRAEHSTLEVAARSTVEAAAAPELPESLGGGAWGELRSTVDAWDDWDFTRPSPRAAPSPALAAFADGLGVEPDGDPLADLLALSDALNETFEYTPGATLVDSPMEQILETGRGVCQDYAHVMLAVARSWGVPSRYVSGYLHVSGPDGGRAYGSATHAWVECRLPGLGWVGFDPTNRCTVDERYVRVAAGRDYSDVAPTRGVLRGGGRSPVEVDIYMTRL